MAQPVFTTAAGFSPVEGAPPVAVRVPDFVLREGVMGRRFSRVDRAGRDAGPYRLGVMGRRFSRVDRVA